MSEILKNEEKILFSLRELYSKYGYQHYKMNRFEEYDLYIRNKDFLLSDQIITFSDRSGRLLAMKPDVTLSIIKNIQDSSGSVQKLYYNENVYRMDKGAQTYKEIMQTGLECVGDIGLVETAEVVLLAAKSLEQMNLSFVLDLSHIGFLNAVLDSAQLSNDVRNEIMLLLHQKNVHELRQLCTIKKVSERMTNLLCALIIYSGDPKYVISSIEPLLHTQSQTQQLQQLRDISNILLDSGFNGRISIDFSTGSQMKYYSGVVFCGYLQGIPNKILSGGQYDTLLQRMGKNSRAVGFAIYLDQLQRLWNTEETPDVDILLLYDKGTDLRTVIDIAQQLRQSASVRVAEVIPDDVTYKKAMKIEMGKAVLVDEYS